MRLDHLLSKDKEIFLSSGTIQLKRKKKVKSAVVYCWVINNLKVFGGDALEGNTRSHPEHDG